MLLFVWFHQQSLRKSVSFLNLCDQVFLKRFKYQNSNLTVDRLLSDAEIFKNMA